MTATPRDLPRRVNTKNTANTVNDVSNVGTVNDVDNVGIDSASEHNAYRDYYNGGSSKNKKKEYIIWCDVETTGVVTFDDELLEVGALVTDMAGNRIGSGFSEIVQVTDMKATVDKCDDYVQQMHTKSGLFEDLWMGGVPLDKVEDLFIQWLKDTIVEFTGEGCDENLVFYFGGRSITLDRNFLYTNTPRIFNIFSHQSIDLTSISIMLERNFTGLNKEAVFAKQATHRALQDSEDCVEQYQSIVDSLSARL